MIKRIAIEHFKSIEKLDVPLGPLTVVVGPNGSGKSNFVDALRFVRDAAAKGLDYAVSERHGIDSIRQWSPSRPYHVSLGVGVKNSFGSGALNFTLSSARGRHKVVSESVSWDPSIDWDSEDGASFPGSTGAHYERGIDGLVTISGQNFQIPDDELSLSDRFLEGYLPLRELLGRIETYSIFPNSLRRAQRPTSSTRLWSTGGNLTSIFKVLVKSKSKKAARRRDEIITALRKVMPNLDSIRIKSLGGLMVPTFRVKESDGRRHDFNVSQISDGTLRLLGLLTALYQPHRPDVIGMEEPEQTVNPGVLAVLADAIREVSQEGTQILVTTHSPHLVDLFEPEEILTAELIDGKTVIQPINGAQKQAVKDRLFSLGELMTAEGLHG